MPNLVPVDHDPFADAAGPASAPTLTPVDHDAFADAPMATQADGAPMGLRNVPTAKDDPVYHGAVPVAQAPDQGAMTAFATGVGGVPVAGPAILGGVERAAAGLRSLTGGGSYDAELQHVQDMTAAARQQHPAAAFAGDLTGSALALAPAVEAAPALFGMGPGGMTASKVLVGAGSGAGIGAGDAAVRSGGDPTSTVEGLVAGAGGGALASAAAPLLARGGTALADYAARSFRPTPAGMPLPIVDSLTRTLSNDGALGPAGAARIAAAGPGGMLVDAAPSLAGTLDAALQRGGPGTAAARQAVDARVAASSANPSAALDSTLGPAQGVGSATDALRANTAAARDAAYRAAYQQPIDYSTDAGRAVETMMRDNVPPGIIARAQAHLRMRPGTDHPPVMQQMARIAPDGTVTYHEMPGTTLVDYVTRSLNDVSSMGDGQGALGGNTTEGRNYGVLGRQLRDALRTAVLEYGTALDTAAQPIQERHALDFGASLLRPNVPRDVAQATIADMTPPELAQARAGVRSHIADTLANVTRSAADPNIDARQAMSAVTMLSSDAARDKLGLLMTPAEAQAIGGRLGQTATSLGLRGAISRNSSTFARTAANAAIDQAAQPGILSRMLMSGGPLKATRPIGEVVTGNTPAQVTARGDAIAGGLGQALTAQAPAADSVLSQLLAAHQARGAASAVAGAIPYGPAVHAGIFSTLLPSIEDRP